MPDTTVAVIGGGVVGAAVLFTLAHRGVDATLLEADSALAYGASGTNSGILHTGFDAKPGELETALILRAAQLRDRVLDALTLPVLRCGAELLPRTDPERETVAALADNARRNGVIVQVRERDGALLVPGESVTDPVAYTLAVADAAVRAGATVRTAAAVEGIDRDTDGLTLHLADGERLACAVAVNCAGLHADTIARLLGDDSFAIYPRKGEFFVFALPGGATLDRILLPVPTARTKGVLVFPTVDGNVIAGPTAVDQEDKNDWTVRPDAVRDVLDKAVAQFPALDGLQPIATYAGLRPAGRDTNYRIGPSVPCPSLVNVAAIRSTGLTASLGIGAHVAELLPALGVDVGPEQAPAPTPAPAPASSDLLWWQRTARHHGLGAVPQDTSD
jgi:glycerol-3-phosphate dehydrogenase